MFRRNKRCLVAHLHVLNTSTYVGVTQQQHLCFGKCFLGGRCFWSSFLWNCFSFFYIFGGEKKIATQTKLVEKIWKRPFLAVFFQTSPLLKGCSQEGFEKTGMLFCLHQKSCSCSSSKVNLGQNKLPFPCLAVLKISWWSARPWELCHPFQQSWISFDDPANE